MPGDYSRFRFDPTRDYAGVLEQQGRVRLDSDHNEGVEIADRGVRAERVDTLGRAAVPAAGGANRDAFRVRVPALGQLTVDPGRIYVDGILAECHGAPTCIAWDAALDEPRATGPVSYDDQPYLAAGSPRGAPSAAGTTDLVYLAVWRREVTELEDPGLTEVALGGPDTTTRLQTAWQVGILPDVGTARCGAGAAWDALTAPSGGRLTVRGEAAPASSDPCPVPERGGFRGLENQLYRVEVHVGGGMGAARFKWNRDNASLAAAVEKVEDAPSGGSLVTVSRLGRDDVNRFQRQEWVEVLDDRAELGGQGGVMARVVDVDLASRVLTVEPRLPAGRFDPADAARHTRVRAWHPARAADADGLVAVAAGPVKLEDGIELSFSLPAGGEFRAGDYWVFAARTVNGWVEPLQDAPPRGVRRHYCALATVTWGATAAETKVRDCRVPWHPGGCCSEVVFPGQSIQDAVDRLPPAGGCVCLKPGLHRVDEPVRIERSSVCLRGESAGVVVRRAGGETVLAIGGAGGETIDHVCVERIRFETGDTVEGDDGVVRVVAASGVSLRGCAFAPPSPDDPDAAAPPFVPAVAVLAAKASELVVERCAVWNLLGGVCAGAASGAVTVADCRFFGPAWTEDDGTRSRGHRGVWLLDDTVGPCQVVRNEFQHYMEAVVVGREAAGTVVADNRVFRDGSALGPAFTSTEQLEALFSGIRPLDFLDGFAIAAWAPGCLIARNEVRLTAAGQKAILVNGSDTMVRENRISAELEPAGGPPLGVVLASRADADENDPWLSGCTVLDNRFAGPVGAILSFGWVQDLQICGNRVTGDRDAYARSVPEPDHVPSRAAVRAVVDGGFALGWGVLASQLHASAIAGNHVAFTLAGIALNATSGVSVRDNHVGACVGGVCARGGIGQVVEGNYVDAIYAAGIYGVDVDRCTAIGNVLRGCGGVAVYLCHGSANTVGENRIEGGGFGIALFRQTRGTAWGNAVIGSARTGIVVNASEGGLMLRDARVLNCGSARGMMVQVFGGTQENVASGVDTELIAAGISLTNCDGIVDLDGCDVRYTGEPVEPGGSRNTGRRFAVFGSLMDRVQVRGCTLVGAELPPGDEPLRGGALHLYCFDNLSIFPQSPWSVQREWYCRVSDSVLEGYEHTIALCWVLGGEVDFDANRCQKRQEPQQGSGKYPAVLMFADMLCVNGNRIRGNVRMDSPTLTIYGTHLVATGNTSYGGAEINVTTAVVPSPYANFNATF